MEDLIGPNGRSGEPKGHVEWTAISNTLQWL